MNCTPTNPPIIAKSSIISLFLLEDPIIMFFLCLQRRNFDSSGLICPSCLCSTEISISLWLNLFFFIFIRAEILISLWLNLSFFFFVHKEMPIPLAQFILLYLCSQRKFDLLAQFILLYLCSQRNFDTSDLICLSLSQFKKKFRYPSSLIGPSLSFFGNILLIFVQ